MINRTSFTLSRTFRFFTALGYLKYCEAFTSELPEGILKRILLTTFRSKAADPIKLIRR